ncbi:MAG TPA: N-succinylarginine dihydrolase, partial [Gemmataceae bacterium]|nr:N-succinylarginine dihydrolase [Gemmataceae bacterium]
MTPAHEVNFDGLVGPTHNYGVLSWGNRASMTNWGETSSPKAAALQGLEKMKRLHDLGGRQGVLPPPPRPRLGPLRQLGFTGADADVLRRAAEEAPKLLAACYSASAMWAANSATVTPSGDSADGKAHFTPANLVSKFHRALEADQTAATLRAIFAGDDQFRHHAPLPAAAPFADEGAANHCRLCLDHGGPGLHLFVYGRDEMGPGFAPRRFPARQSRQACEAVARRHGLPAARAVFARQNPAAIDAGVFHNDVIAASHRDVFFYHELAYVDSPAVVKRLSESFEALTGRPLRTVEVAARELPLELVVRSYLFNSQIVTAADGRTVLVAPRECEREPRVRSYLGALLARKGSPFGALEYVGVGQSMQGGGGPACLRLRVVLTEEQIRGLRGDVLLTEELYERLRGAVERTYPEKVSFADLADPAFLNQCRVATAAVYADLGLAGLRHCPGTAPAIVSGV